MYRVHLLILQNNATLRFLVQKDSEIRTIFKGHHEKIKKDDPENKTYLSDVHRKILVDRVIRVELGKHENRRYGIVSMYTVHTL